MRLYRLFLLMGFTLALVLNSFIGVSTKVMAQSTTAKFAQVSCASISNNVQLPQDLKEGSDVVCGYVTVPADHTNPSGDTLKLAVAVLKSTSAKPQSDAIIYLEGGPGGSSLSALYYYGDAFGPLRQNRDVVLLDQRGTVDSIPNLACPEELKVAYSLVEKVTPPDKAIQLDEAALLQCHDRLAKRGVNFADYNSTQNAADVDDVMNALGYAHYNLYGISYGTRLAEYVMRDFPDHVRSVVIDSVVPLDADLEDHFIVNLNRAFTAVWDACKADTVCNSAYPDLEKDFYDTVDKLNQKPVTVKVDYQGDWSPYIGKTFNVAVDGDAMITFLFESLYVTSAVPDLPYIIYHAKNGDFTKVAQTLMENLQFDESFATGMQLAVNCHEEEPFAAVTTYDQLSKDQPAALVKYGQQLITEDHDVCNKWGAGGPDKGDNLLVKSTIPTIVFAGQFDPITPPAGSQHVADGIQNSTFVLIANGGHGPSLEGPCQMHIMTSFFDDPSTQPDVSCVQAINPPLFALPANKVTINMVPFTSNKLGISGLTPDGWDQVQEGVFSYPRSQAFRLVHRVRGDKVAGYLKFIQDANQLANPPKKIDTLQANGYKWVIYEVQLNDGAYFNIAGVDVNNTGYLITLSTPDKEYHDAFYKTVFLADVNAFNVISK